MNTAALAAAAAATLGNATRIVITMEGGMITAIHADTPVEVAIVDYDTDADEGESDMLADVSDDGTTEKREDRAYLHLQDADVAPAFVATRFKQIEKLTCAQS